MNMRTENTQKVDNNRCSSQSSSENNYQNSDNVKHLDIEIDDTNIADGAKKILNVIRPNWNMDNVHFKFFTAGITNKLVGCFNTGEQPSTSSITVSGKQNGSTTTTTPGTPTDCEDVILIRVYGRKTEILIDRKAEILNFKLLYSYGFAPALFAIFKNGLAYEFTPGVTLTPESILQPKIWQLIAKRMAEMHKIAFNHPTNNNKKTELPMLWTKTQKFLKLIPNEFPDDPKYERISKMIPQLSKLSDDFKQLYSHLEKLNSPLVFAHNDLLLGNVIYTKTMNRVTFIDYEYADFNFQGFDIGNHFTEFCGISEVDYSRYPNKEFQMKWLRVYLETYLNTDSVAASDLERLYVQANKFALASHFFWAIWSLIQSQHSAIDFDFIEFAEVRYGEYLAKKDAFLALKF